MPVRSAHVVTACRWVWSEAGLEQDLVDALTRALETELEAAAADGRGVAGVVGDDPKRFAAGVADMFSVPRRRREAAWCTVCAAAVAVAAAIRFSRRR